jgi:PIN domain nuclease of toxin-antitoxin system
MVILDTCAIIETLKIKSTLSLKTMRLMENNSCIMSISLAEIACKYKIGKLELSITPRELFQKIKEIQNLKIIDIGITEWLDSIDLDWNENKDPADRMITSFAIKNELSIVTTDEKIKKFYKNVIW